MVKVSSADFQRHIGQYQDKALTEPVVITRNGRERVVLIAIEEYERLKRRDRVVGLSGELGEATIELIEKTEMDARHKHLDDELGDWKP